MKRLLLISLFFSSHFFLSCHPAEKRSELTFSSQPSDSVILAEHSEISHADDYTYFERVRVFDRQGFDVPVEAFSILVPKDWKVNSEIEWISPQNSCAGTYIKLTASSPDNRYSYEILPGYNFSWNTDPQLLQTNMQFSTPSEYCSFAEPMNAENYLKAVLIPDYLNQAEIISLEHNNDVTASMQQANQKAASELMQYGAAQVNFDQSALNAEVSLSSNQKALVILGVTNTIIGMQNPYNGAVNQILNTQVSERTVFRYPAAEKEQAEKIFSVIKSSVRSNSAWSDAVNGFWKNMRQQRQQISDHKIRIMDEQTRRIGEQAIQRGNERLAALDNEIRTWEQKQNANDRMHTNFVKAIREVETFSDANGTYEMSAGYNHAWSRGDGRSFILSDNPNFNPASVLQDQNWQQMKKVD